MKISCPGHESRNARPRLHVCVVVLASANLLSIQYTRVVPVIVEAHHAYHEAHWVPVDPRGTFYAS